MKLAVTFLAVALLVIGTTALVGAEETSRGNYTSAYQPLADFLNETDCISHSHTYVDRYEPDTDTWRPPAYVPERRNPMGVGLDTTVWEGNNMGAEVQYKYDVQNGEHSTFLVGQLNLWKMLGGK